MLCGSCKNKLDFFCNHSHCASFRKCQINITINILFVCVSVDTHTHTHIHTHTQTHTFYWYICVYLLQGKENMHCSPFILTLVCFSDILVNFITWGKNFSLFYLIIYGVWIHILYIYIYIYIHTYIHTELGRLLFVIRYKKLVNCSGIPGGEGSDALVLPLWSYAAGVSWWRRLGHVPGEFSWRQRVHGCSIKLCLHANWPSHWNGNNKDIL